MIAKKYLKFIEDYKDLFPELTQTKKVVLVDGCPLFILENKKIFSFKNYYDFDGKLKEPVPEIFRNLNDAKEKFKKENDKKLEKEWNKITLELKGKKLFPPTGIFQLHQYDGEWYKAINILMFANWSEVIPDTDNKMVISNSLLPFPVHTNDIIGNQNTGYFLIEDMKDSGDFFNNPLFKIKKISEDEALKCKRNRIEYIEDFWDRIIQEKHKISDSNLTK